MSAPTITAYLAELEQQLRRRRAPRARLLREVEGHLDDTVEELTASGVARADAEAEAVRRFGAAANVAARFAAAAASTTAHRAVDLASVAFVGYVASFLAFASSASSAVRDFPQGAPSFFAIQLAAVALGVAFVRSWRWRSQLAVPRAELTFLARALALGVAALAMSAVGETLLALTRPAGVVVWDAAHWLTLGFAAAAVVVLVAALGTVRAAAQVAAVGALPGDSDARDRRGAAMLLDDVVALTPRLPLSPSFRLNALHPLRHPWRLVSLLAAHAFVAVTGVQLVSSEGLHHASIIGGATLLGLFEAVAIIGCFALFGRFLGLRDAGPSPPLID
jgi:hypothetical protein